MIASDDSDVTSTINREKIENPIPYDNNCIKDELGYVENTSKLSKILRISITKQEFNLIFI